LSTCNSCGSFCKSLPRNQQIKFHSDVLRYVFRLDDSRRFSVNIKELGVTHSPKKIRLRIQRSGKLLKNHKLFTYASVKYAGIPGKIFEVRDHEVDNLLKSLHTDKNLHHYLKSLTPKYPPLLLAGMDNLVQDVLTDKNFDVFTKKFIHRKMKFIMQSTGTALEDIQQDLFSWATYSIYRAYPKIESPIHAINIAKQAAHNRGINYIIESTSQSRQRLVKNADGTFSSKNVPLHSLLTVNGSKETLSYGNALTAGINGRSMEGVRISSYDSGLDFKISYTKFCGKLSLKMQDLMKLWSGVYDEKFSKTLGVDNDEWYNHLQPKEYLTRCSEYVGVPLKEAKAFHRSVQTQFQAYK